MVHGLYKTHFCKRYKKFGVVPFPENHATVGQKDAIHDGKRNTISVSPLSPQTLSFNITWMDGNSRGSAVITL